MNPADLAELLKATATAVLTEHALDTAALPATVTVERPRNPEHGDYASNLALQLGKKVGVNPRELAGWLADALAQADGIASAEVAGPGFINLRLDASAQGADRQQRHRRRPHLRQLRRRGRTQHQPRVRLGQPDRADPHRRHPLGGRRRRAGPGADRRQGADVVREYYFNDHGAQIDRFASSLIAAAKGEPTPEDGYAGSYIADIAAQVLQQAPDALSQPDAEQHETFRRIGVDLMFAHIKQSLHDFGIDFDVYTHEESMHTSGRVDQAIARLRENGNVYEKDGATWLRTTDFGDDKDRVVIKSDGEPTYFAADSPTTWTSGSAASTCASTCSAPTTTATSPGSRPPPPRSATTRTTVEVLIGQMVNLVRDGQPVKMSKRAGTVITLDDLVEAIGVDAARYA